MSSSISPGVEPTYPSEEYIPLTSSPMSSMISNEIVKGPDGKQYYEMNGKLYPFDQNVVDRLLMPPPPVRQKYSTNQPDEGRERFPQYIPQQQELYTPQQQEQYTPQQQEKYTQQQQVRRGRSPTYRNDYLSPGARDRSRSPRRYNSRSPSRSYYNHQDEKKLNRIIQMIKKKVTQAIFSSELSEELDQLFEHGRAINHDLFVEKWSRVRLRTGMKNKNNPGEFWYNISTGSWGMVSNKHRFH